MRLLVPRLSRGNVLPGGPRLRSFGWREPSSVCIPRRSLGTRLLAVSSGSC